MYEFETDSEGNLNLQWADPAADNYIKPGSYDVSCVQAADGYVRSTENQKVTFEADGSTFTGEIGFKSRKNEPITLKVIDSDGNPVPNVVFNMHWNNRDIGDCGSTDETGTYQYSSEYGFSNGTYDFEIKFLPNTYYTSNEKHSITVNDSGLSSGGVLEFTAVKCPEIHVKTVDKFTGEALQGAFYEIKLDGVSYASQAASNESGEYVISASAFAGIAKSRKVSPDSGAVLTVTETRPPSHYNYTPLSDQTYTITKVITAEDRYIEIVFYATPYRDLIVNTSCPAPATITIKTVSTLYKGGGTIQTGAQTGQNGNTDNQVVFEGLSCGTYTLTQHAAGMYGLADVEMTIVISDEDGATVEVTFPDPENAES